MPHTVEVIENPAAAAAALHPVRARILAELAEPASATAVAARVGATRQRVNYHLRGLEQHGLVAPAGERLHGGLVERLLVATAAGYVLSPEALGPAEATPANARERLGARYLAALAGRMVKEVGRLLRGSAEPATFALDAEVGLRSPAARVAFADDLARAVSAVIQRHHVDGGSPHRVVVGAHPIPDPDKEPSQ